MFTDADIIHAYTRADALADGNLIDITEAAREAGFRIPMAITRAAWEDCVAWSEQDTARTGVPQDETGRLWDVVWMSLHAARQKKNGDRVQVELWRVPKEGQGHQPKLVHLVLQVGPGDSGEPVLTVMLPEDN